MMKTTAIKPLGFGLASMAMGSALVFVTLFLINKFGDVLQDQPGERQVAIDFEKKEPPPSQRVVRRPPPPPRNPPVAPPAPLSGLGTNLSGLDFGLPAFDAEAFGQMDSLLGDANDVTMTDDAVDEPPRPTIQTPLQYPVRAKAQGVEGYVLMSVLISPTGNVERVKVLESAPEGVFDDTAIAGVRGWKFEPATYQGESVRVWATQRVSFELG